MSEPEQRRCPQCWQPRDFPDAFIGARGGVVNMCRICRERYYGWQSKTAAEKFATPRTGVPAASAFVARLFRRSGNRKLGPIPASITARGSCPPSCSFYEAGCYAEYHVLAAHWRRVGVSGSPWDLFCRDVAQLPSGQLWRHNVAGDLPGEGDRIDREALGKLVTANMGRRGFTFSHKPILRAGMTGRQNRLAIAAANEAGFVVNVSADNLEQADEYADIECAPVAVVLPADAPIRLRTPAGRRVVVCPAQTPAALTCATCGLCAIRDRKAIVGFRAHGQAAAHVSSLVQLRRRPAA